MTGRGPRSTTTLVGPNRVVLALATGGLVALASAGTALLVVQGTPTVDPMIALAPPATVAPSAVPAPGVVVLPSGQAALLGGARPPHRQVPVAPRARVLAAGPQQPHPQPQSRPQPQAGSLVLRHAPAPVALPFTDAPLADALRGSGAAPGQLGTDLPRLAPQPADAALLRRAAAGLAPAATALEQATISRDGHRTRREGSKAGKQGKGGKGSKGDKGDKAATAVRDGRGAGRHSKHDGSPYGDWSGPGGDATQRGDKQAEHGDQRGDQHGDDRGGDRGSRDGGD